MEIQDKIGFWRCKEEALCTNRAPRGGKNYTDDATSTDVFYFARPVIGNQGRRRDTRRRWQMILENMFVSDFFSYYDERGEIQFSHWYLFSRSHLLTCVEETYTCCLKIRSNLRIAFRIDNCVQGKTFKLNTVKNTLSRVTKSYSSCRFVKLLSYFNWQLSIKIFIC